MSFSEPFNPVNAGDFVYGLYNGNKTIVWLENKGCVRVMSESKAVNAAYDLNVKYTVNSGGNHSIKRASKTGLNLFVLKGRTVHFVLDDINMDQVPLKSYNGEQAANRSITGAELRWLYRHRDVAEIQANIQFWYNKKPTTPPWQNDSANYSAEWKKYVKDSQNLIDVSAVNLSGTSAPVAPPTQSLFSQLFCCFS